MVPRRSFLKQVIAGAAAVSQGAETPIETGDAAQLFLDDHVIGEMKGLRRELHQPRKTGLIQEADGNPWEAGTISWVARDARGRLHMAYSFSWPDPSVKNLSPRIGEDKAQWHRSATAYAVSEDGIRWRKPKLGIVDGPTGLRLAPREKWADGIFHEATGLSKDNNLGYPLTGLLDLGSFGGMRDPKRRYLTLLRVKDDIHVFAKTTQAGLYFAEAIPDVTGDSSWKKKLRPVWEGTPHDPPGRTFSNVTFDEKAGLWFQCNQSSMSMSVGRRLKTPGWEARGASTRDICRFTSRDLLEWSDEELVIPVAEDESREQTDWVEYMDIHITRAGDFWLGQLLLFHGDRSSEQYRMPRKWVAWRKGTTEVRLMISRDAGKTWQRVGGKQLWIPHHPEDTGFDRLAFPGNPVRMGDELWLYYSAYDGDHLNWNRDGTLFYKNRIPRIGRTARAVLRWDGFVSVGREGELVTRPMRLTGRSLTVNAAASKGSLRVELEDEAGRALRGFSLADCRRLTGDGVAQRVSWKSAGALPSQPVRLRFEVRDADLYGFRSAS